MKQTEIHCSASVRKLWPSPLAEKWASIYPEIFDEDDIRITRLQPTKHFSEWLAAIYLFHRDGVLSLVEKYVFRSHTRKQAILRQLLSDTQCEVLGEIRGKYGVQPPDLLVFTPDYSHFSFVEVKGPGDQLRNIQKQSHAAIRRQLGVPVQILTVSILESAPSKIGNT